MVPDLVPRAARRTNRGFLHAKSASFVYGESPPPIPNRTASPAVSILPPPELPVEHIFILGTTTWGMHPIGRELGDISAVPTLDGPHTFSLEQTPSGATYLRAVRDDGIQIWTWLMPEKTRDVELVCGDWMGGALISANRGKSYTLYTVGKDGKLRWQYTLAGLRKGHAYNLKHTVNVLSQSANGSNTRVTGLDEVTGEKEFELTIPASQERFVNVRRSGTKILCGPTSSTFPVGTIASRLFVNIDGFAYVAFTQSERTLETATCTPGSVIEPRNVNVARQGRVGRRAPFDPQVTRRLGGGRASLAR
jgi:hypothetical protein